MDEGRHTSITLALVFLTFVVVMIRYTDKDRQAYRWVDELTDIKSYMHARTHTHTSLLSVTIIIPNSYARVM
jgi:hypothetical protein